MKFEIFNLSYDFIDKTKTKQIPEKQRKNYFDNEMVN